MAFLNPVDTQEVIDIGTACTFLAEDDITTQSVFGNPYPVKKLPLVIQGVTDVLSFAYSNNSYNTNINSIANYLLSLCGKYIPKAQKLLGQKTGVVVGTGGQNLNQLITPRDFPQIIVGKAGSLIQDGDTSFTIIDPDAAPNGKVNAWCFIERELTDDADATITDQMTVQPQWLPNQGYSFTLENGATFKTGQVVRGQYPVAVNLTVPTSSGTVQDLNFYATLNGAETKDLYNTKGQIFLVPTNAFEWVKFVIFCTSNLGEKTSCVWNGQVYNDGSTVTLIDDDRSEKGAHPFGLTFFFSPTDPLTPGNMLVAADNSFKGIRISMTGIAGKIINCNAQFSFYTSNV